MVSSSGGLPVEWERYPDLRVGDYVAVRVRYDALPLRGTVVGFLKGRFITIDRGEFGRIQINDYLDARKISLLERIAEEVSDAEESRP